MPTQQGSDAFVGPVQARDGDLARMFLATGPVPLGKTRLSEFGFSASAEHPRLGAVRSPWDTDHTAGASSAGSAALVAAGAVPLRMRTTAAARSGSRPRSTGWSGSSPPATGSPRTS